MRTVVTQTAPVVTTRLVEEITITCDFCGESYDENDYYTNHLDFWIDPDECVSARLQRDVCADCHDLVIKAIISALGGPRDGDYAPAISWVSLGFDAPLLGDRDGNVI